MDSLTTEIVKAADAPWAPKVPGAQWAWRVMRGTEQLIAGASIKNKRAVNEMARSAARRLENTARGRSSINWNALNRVGFGRGDYA